MILIFLVGAVLIVMTYVVPKLEPLFSSTNVELPASTQALVATSHFVGNNIVFIVVLLLIAVFAFKTYISTYQGKKRWDMFLMKIPLLGDIYRNYAIVRVASSLAILLSAGIPIIKTLRLAGESADNVMYEEALQKVADKVSSGNKLAQSMEEIDPAHLLFTQDFLQIISAGEQTSTVNKVCVKIADQYKKEVEHSLSVFVKLLEPLAILIAGLFVLWFAMAIFSAVVKITDTVG